MASKPVQLVQDKPVAVTGTLTTVAVAVEGYLEWRGWIPAPLTGVAMVVTVAVLAAVAHELVAPWKKVQQVVQQGLHLTDADWGRIEVVLEQAGLALIPRPVTVVTPVTAIVAPPDGMTAGQHAAPVEPPAAPGA